MSVPRHENLMDVTVLVFCAPMNKLHTSERVVYGDRAYNRVKKEMADLGWEIKEEFGCAVEFQ